MIKRFIFIIFVLLILALGAWRVLTHRQEASQSNLAGDVAQDKPFNKNLHSIDQPGSIWWVVNKTRPLPDGYVPPDLVVPNMQLAASRNAEQMQIRSDVAAALQALHAAAEQADIKLKFISGYRSYAYQKRLYNSYVARDGQVAADYYSARPGTSEHQTGLAADLGRPDGHCELDICFGTTAEGQWLAAHAHEYGFIIRYPEGKETITRYQYEPWHLRYVGKELAIELHRTGDTMEEFFGL